MEQGDSRSFKIFGITKDIEISILKRVPTVCKNYTSLLRSTVYVNLRALMAVI